MEVANVKKVFQSLTFTAVLALVVLGAQGASAHVFIEENFDDSLAFNRAPVPQVTDVNSDVDTFDDNKTTHTPSLVIASTGTLTTDHSLSGDTSFCMGAGEGFAAVRNLDYPSTGSWNGQTTGPFQYVQMAVSVAEITAAAGTEVARLTYTWEDLEPGNWIVTFESDGAGGVDVIAALDGVSTSTTEIGHIDGGYAEWQMVTVQVQKNAGAANDPMVGNGFTTGARFYCGSDTPGLFLPATSFVAAGPPVRNPKAMDMSFMVSHGKVFVDDVYWEGGMTATDEGRDFTDLRHFKAFTVPVVLNQLKLE